MAHARVRVALAPPAMSAAVACVCIGARRRATGDAVRMDTCSEQVGVVTRACSATQACADTICLRTRAHTYAGVGRVQGRGSMSVAVVALLLAAQDAALFEPVFRRPSRCLPTRPLSRRTRCLAMRDRQIDRHRHRHRTQDTIYKTQDAGTSRPRCWCLHKCVAHSCDHAHVCLRLVLESVRVRVRMQYQMCADACAAGVR